MTTTDLGSLTDAIPLLDDNGSGVYIKGRNDIGDTRRQLLGALFASSGGAFTPRPGVLATNYSTAAATWTNKRVTAQASPNQQITLGAGQSVVARTNQGLYLVSQETDLTVTMPGSDGTNPRIDVLYEIPYDKGVGALGDTLHGPHLICETGTPAGSPVAPGVPANANILAQVFRRTTGASPSGNIIQPGDITDKRKSSALAGVVRPLLPGDALSDAGGYHGEERLRTGTSFIDSVWRGLGYTEMKDRWSAVDVKWHGVTPVGMVTAYTTWILVDNIANGAEPTVASTTVADPGYPYRLRVSGDFLSLLNPQGALTWKIHSGTAGGAVVFNNGVGWSVTRNAEPSTGTGGSAGANRFLYPSGMSTVSFTGAVTLVITAKGEPSNVAVLGAALAGGSVQYEVVPV